MTKYTYWDSNKSKWEYPSSTCESGHWVKEKVFECIADDILEADDKFEKIFGNKVSKMANIGCTVTKGS